MLNTRPRRGQLRRRAAIRRHRSRSSRPQGELLEPRYVLDSTVVFNEVMYNPAGADEALEWIELHNQMSVDMEVSGWRVEGGITFDLPEGAVVPGHGYLVIAKDPAALAAAGGFADALGPFDGSLSNGGERLELYSHYYTAAINAGASGAVLADSTMLDGRRLMDSLDYADQGAWPMEPDGSGVSLAKRHEDLGSAQTESWTFSAQLGGTPGKSNFPVPLPPPPDFLGELTDSSGNDNHGAPVDLLLTDEDGGYEGTAGVFNGSSSYAQIPININPATRTRVTIGAWVKIDGISSPARHEIISSDNGGYDRAITIDSRQGTGETGVPRYSAFGGSSTGLVTGPTASSQDDWTFIAAAFDAAAGSTTLYVNDQTTQGSATHNPSQTFVRIGNHAFNFEYFHGLIDNVFLFDGVLTAGQINTIRAGGADAIKSLAGPALLGFYEFNQAGEPATPLTQISDSSEFHNDGQPVNLTLTAAEGGYEGTAGVFNGANSHVQVPIDINPAARPQVTIGAWVKPAAVNNPARHEIISSDNGGFDRAITIDSRQGGGETGVPRYGAFGGSSTGLVTGPLASSQDDWTFIAAAFDAAAGATTLYVNDQTTQGNATHNPSQSFLRIGNHPTNIEYFNGLIDNAFVFLGLLTPAQINSIRDGGAAAIKNIQGATLLGLFEFEPEIPDPDPEPETPIELPALAFNYGSDELALEGMVLSGSDETQPAYSFPAGTLPAGGFLSLDENQLGFRPAADDRLFLFTSDGVSVITAARIDGSPLARLPDGTGRWLTATSASFGAANPSPLEDAVVINEILYHAYPYRDEATPYQDDPQEWIEFYNRSATRSIDLTGWRLAGAVEYEFPAGQMLEPNQFLVVSNDSLQLRATRPAISDVILGDYRGALADGGELIQLLDSRGNPADEVHYFDSGRWPLAADGRGSSLELRDPGSDNSAGEAWAASLESSGSEWRTYSYRGTAVDDGLGNDIFHEFVLGLLNDGEILLDDIQVIEDPDGAAVSLLPNGDFQSDALGALPANWRLIGTHGDHGRSLVAADPDDPANRVLHLVATGPTEDKHNQASTTYANNQRVDLGQEYEISFRAKWLSGSNQVNTRLYFNFLQATTLIDTPHLPGTPGAENSTHETNAGPTYRQLEHAPVTPAAGEPVTISVTADDPRGVSSLMLYYSVNGGPRASATMEAVGNGIYQGSIPGQNSGAAVQFYVVGEDAQGATSTFPAAGSQSRAMYQVQDLRARLGTLHNLRIIMTPQDTAFMYTNVNRMSNDRLGATVIYNEREVFYNVGVRLKGSAYGRNNDSVTGLSLEFPPDQLFRGVHSTISIERSADHRELIAKHLLNRAGGGLTSFYDDVAHIITPRSQDTGLGLLAMARTTDLYLESLYGPAGSEASVYNFELLYSPQGTTNGAPASPKLNFPYTHRNGHPDIEDLGPDKEAYRWNFQLRGGRGRDDYGPLVAAAQAFSLNGQALQNAVEPLIDVDQWMRTFAMMSINGNDDFYTRLWTHNFRMIARPEDERLIAVPWDLDRAFRLANNAHPWTQIDSQGDDNNLRKIIERPVNTRLFWGHVLDIANTTANSAYLNRWMNHYGGLTGRSYAGELNYILNRTDFLLGNLPAQIPFQITTNNGNDFTATESYATLRGTGWVDVRNIYLDGREEPLSIQWLDGQQWQINVPLQPGLNEIQLQATNHQNQMVGADTIQITTEVVNPLVQSLRITELMYHPPAPEAGSPYDAEDFEYIELTNTSEQPLDLEGVQFVEGVSFTFPPFQLQPHQYVVVVKDQAAFVDRYGQAALVAGEFESGSLSNGGEPIGLSDRAGAVLAEFAYDDQGAWPAAPDGRGASLQVVDLEGDYNQAENWRSSTEYGGSPGAAGLELARDIVVNEVLTHTDPPELDAIELYNAGDSAVDIGGWFLSDSWDNYRKFRIPDGTVLAAGEYLVFDESQFNASGGADPDDFALDSARGDQVWLMAADANGALTRFADSVSFTAAFNGVSFGRWPNGQGELAPMQTVTRGALNSAPRVDGVVLSEIMYHPPSSDGLDSADLEYVELLNSTSGPADLTHWRLGGGIDFEFADGTELAAGERVVIVSFDPSDPGQQAARDALTQYYQVSPQARLLGPFSGRLDNRRDRIQLLRPDEPPLDEPDLIPGVLVDEVVYSDRQPWPLEADGLGAALRRVSAEVWGTDPANWRADGPTPGEAGRAPRVLSVSINEQLIDPEDLGAQTQPTSWTRQRSQLGSLLIQFSEPVQVTAADFVLTNLGVNAPADGDAPVVLADEQISSTGRFVRIDFLDNMNDILEDGVYQLRILPTAVDLVGTGLDGDGDGLPGGEYLVRGDDANRFYQLAGEWNGDAGVSIFDFPVFAYWFGQSVPTAPAYVDLNQDGGVTIFDFPRFAAAFASAIIYPTPLAAPWDPSATDAALAQLHRQAEPVVERILAEDDSWWEDWNAPRLPRQRLRWHAETEATVKGAELEAVLEVMAAERII